ncbi:MAG: metallophosphoesterase [Nocardioidaceae bacterium]|jgi:predicted phosphodiesterase|nr:metallophosphoesterase [Nocardioidaceae bacterium]
MRSTDSTPGGTPHRGPRWREVTVCVVVSLLVGGAVAVTGFLSDSRPVTVGAHSGRVQPTTDGWATLNLGGLLPAVRVDAGLPLSLGMRLDLIDTEVASLEEVVRSDAVIASAPEGEIGMIRNRLVTMAWVHAARGGGIAVLTGLLLAVAWRRGGPAALARVRTATAGFVRHPTQGLRAGPLAVAVATGVALVGVALPALTRVEPDPPTWRSLTAIFPEAAAVPQLEDVEVADGAEVRGAASLIQGAIDTYRQSVEFYDGLADHVPRIADELRQPAEDEVVALLVSDRHDNVGMDATVAAVAREGGASVLIDAGDDTSSGASWETFSIDSLAEAADDMEVVAVPGNHDQGDTVGTRMEERGFTVLQGRPTQVAGIRFLGDADPRSSGYTPERVAGQETISEQADRLADVACEDGDVTTMVVHDPNSGLEAAERGCVDLVLSGHLHRQVGPTAVTAPDGSVATTYTNGTTGGAAFSIALGSKLRRPAQMTLVTYADQRPVGLQPVDITTGGTFEVQEWREIPPEVSISAPSEPRERL